MQILGILHDLDKKDTITVYSVAEKVYPGAKRSYDKYKNCNKVISRFKKLEYYGLIEVMKENSKNSYCLLMDRCFVVDLAMKKFGINGKFMLLLVAETDKVTKQVQDRWALFQIT